MKLFTIILLFMSMGTLMGCKKYLEAKSDQSLVVINSNKDLQSLVDNYALKQTAGADETSADDYYLSYQNYQSLNEAQRNMYTWQNSNLFIPVGANKDAWSIIYENVYIANTVLDHIDKGAATDSNFGELNNIKGQALFLRSFSFFKAVGIWSLAFDDHTAKTDLGIPLRLTSDFNEPSKRSSVLDTYAQIINDAKQAVNLLPDIPIHVYRPSKPAAYALLAKTYLLMRKYELAELYADSCLQLKNTLLDYNSLNTSAAYPIPAFNKEIIYESYLSGNSITAISASRARIDTTLYQQYESNDLRKPAFFSIDASGLIIFKGSYEGGPDRFAGIAVDEVLLIRAECMARRNNVDDALTDLNSLLKNRYKNGTFLSVSSKKSAEV